MTVVNKTAPHSAPPEGSILVPKASDYHFACNGIEIEGDDEHGVDVQFPWEAHPTRSHDHHMSIEAFYMDRTPVTNGRYARYLQESKYMPTDTRFWLRPWNGSFTPPEGIARMPVTYVSFHEARLFCAWAGGRL